MTLDEFEKLTNSATPGPWRWAFHGADFVLGADNHLVLSGPDIFIKPAQAQFIATCRDMVPKLIKLARVVSAFGFDPAEDHKDHARLRECLAALDQP